MKIEFSEEFYRRLAEIEEPEGGVFACSPEIYAEMTRSIPMMRAKLQVQGVTDIQTCTANWTPENRETVKSGERLTFMAVCLGRAYNEDGTGDEDNTYSRWSPQANLDLVCMNPALFGKFNVGDKFYVDFTAAE